MKKEEYLEILEKIKDLIELANNSKEDELDEHIKSLQKDYEDFFIWAIGEKKLKVDKEEVKTKWGKLHPKLPIPRVFKTDYDLGKEVSTVCLFMDAYPLYLESLKK